MPNLRINYKNVALENLTLVTSTTAGNLVATNMLTDLKSEVWRSTSTTASITLTWTALKSLSFVGLPFCNLSPTATMRVRLYTNVADGTAVLDTGNIVAAPGQMSNASDFGMPTLGVNNFAYGGYSYAELWFAATNCRKCLIDIIDTSNASGYVECAKVVVGDYWSPVNNPPIDSVRVGITELSKHERSEAGSLHTDRGPIFKTLTFNLSHMPQADKNIFWRITRGNGMTRPVYVSLTPDSTDAMEEQIFQIYGKLSRQSDMQYTFMDMFASTLQIEEI